MDRLKINEAFRNVYAQLYTSQYQAGCDEIPNFLNDLSIPAVSPHLKKKLKEPISQAEIAIFPKKKIFFLFLHYYTQFLWNVKCKVLFCQH